MNISLSRGNLMFSPQVDSDIDNGIGVYLVIWGVDPDDVTRVLSVQPTSTRRKGEPWPPRPERVHPEHSWDIKSPLHHKASAREQLDALIDILKPNIEGLASLPPHYVKLEYFFWTDEKPVIDFSNDQIKFLAQINTEFVDIDANYFDNPYVVRPGIQRREDIIDIGLGIRDVEPQIVTSILDIQPNASYPICGLYPELKKLHRNEHSWDFSIHMHKPKDDRQRLGLLFEQKIDELIGILQPKIKLFSDLPDHKTYFECSMYAGNNQWLGLTKAQIKFLAQINAAVNIDYNYYWRNKIIRYGIHGSRMRSKCVVPY
jgi:hypothetical protein